MGKGVLRIVALAGLAVLALACSSAQPSTGGGGATSGPKQGGILNEPATDDPFDYDMTYTGSSNTNPYIIKRAYDSLLTFKVGPDIAYSDAVVGPNLAEKWEVSSDVKTYTFHLRKGVKWANMPPLNGRELTAEDIKWTYEYVSRTGQFKDMKLPVSRYDFFFEGMESMTVTGPQTLVVKFKEGFAPFLNYVASTDNPIMPHEIFDKDKHFKDMIVGSGPFQLDTANSQKGAKVVLKKNPTYFLEGKPMLDGINLIVMKEESTRQAAFRAKQVDAYIGTRDPSVTDDIKKVVPGSVVLDFTSTPSIIAPNFKRAPFDKLAVRQAVSLALDRDELIKAVAGGQGKWALAFSNVRDDLYTQEQIKAFVKYDQTAAKKLLTDAGLANGFSAEMIYSADGDDTFLTAAQLIQAQLKKVGISINLKPLDATTMTQRRRAFDCDICFLSEAARADLDGQLFLAAKTGGPSNYNQIADPKADAMIVAQRQEGDPAKRTQILKDVLKHLNESGDAVATWRVTLTILTQPYVKNFYINADTRNQGWLNDTWLDK